MAGGIKGITVKIGGDTTELGRSLKDASMKATALQGELKGVNSLLKFDPGNVTLLKQKSDLLKQSIEQTKQKLNDLVEVQKKVDSGEIEMTEEEYRNLQREIASTEQKLKNLTDQQKDFGSVSAQQVAQVGEKFKDVGSKVEDVGKKVSALSAVTGAVLGGSVMSASNYEDALAKVSTIADTSKVSMSDLSAEIMELSSQTGISANDIADATYNAISAGQDTVDAVDFVSNATSLARAGFTDTASSIDILTTIMNAYGLEADKVGMVSDMLIQTQNKGKTTVAELSASMGKIIPTANSMGVGLEQITAGYSIMTAKGIATAESTTYMNSMLNELGKSGSKVAGALKKETGKSFQELMAEGKSLGDVLQIVKDHADKTGVGFNDLWSSSEAGKAGITLLSDGVDAFNESVAGMIDSTGATSTALEKLDTPSQKARVAINQLKNSSIALGESALSALAPLIDKIAQAVEKLTTWFNNLSPGVKQIIVIILGLVTALGPALIIIGKVISSVGTILTLGPKIVTMFNGIKTAFTALGAVFTANPIGIIIVALTALVAGLIYAYNHSEKFREIVNNAFTKVKEVVGNIVQALVNFFKVTLPEAISAMIEWFKSIPSKIYNAIVGAISLVASWGASVANTAKQKASEMVSGVISFVTQIPRRISSAISGAISIVASWGSNMLSTARSKMSSVVSGIVGAFNGLPGQMVSIGRNVIQGVINGIGSMVGSLYSSIKSALSGLVSKAKSALGIHSPSRVFADVVGKQIPAGIAVGMEDNQGVADKAVGDMTRSITDQANADIEALNGATINRQLNTTFTNQDRANTSLSEVMATMREYGERLIEASKRSIVLDTGTLVGETIDAIDAGLASNQLLKARGV